MIPPQEIVCVECGGRAKLLSFLPEDGEVEVGDVLAYRCGECLDRWDVVMEDPIEDGEMGRQS